MSVDVPARIVGRTISLRYEKTVPGDDSKGLVPFYHFKILDISERVVGHINFRVGDTLHVRNTAGHIGYQIEVPFRGNNFSLEACRALGPFIKTHYDVVILTTDPTNAPSIKTIEKLGARFIDEVEVPESDPAYAAGARRKRRYEWEP